MLRFCICRILGLALRGPSDRSRLLDRAELLWPGMTHGRKQNRLGNLKIWRTKGVRSQQSFSQSSAAPLHCTSLLKRPGKKPNSRQPGRLPSQLWQGYSIRKSKQVSPLSGRYIIIKIIFIATPVTAACNLWVFALSWHSPDWQHKACVCDKFSVRDSSY